jgi:hypothetical protein
MHFGVFYDAGAAGAWLLASAFNTVQSFSSLSVVASLIWIG